MIIMNHFMVNILMKEDYWQPIIKNMYATLNRASIKMEYFVFDDDNRQHLATERSDGSIIDDEDNEYW